MNIHVRYLVYGSLLGFSLSRMGFSDYEELHRMFTLADVRLFLVFAGGVGLTALGFRILHRASPKPAKPIHPGTIVGGILFGLGWAIAGACPGVVLVQLGEGRLLALFTLIGMVFGSWLYPRVHAKLFRWDMGSCDV